MRYALWNNKGGVGKTFFAFHLACYVANRLKKAGDKRKVVIIDMCPQANVSEIVLGGNGQGSIALDDIISNGRTVASYFNKRIETSPYQIGGFETDYLTQVSEINNKVSDNLYLVAGDPAVELQIPTINLMAGADLPAEAWIKVHKWIEDMITALDRKWNQEAIYFIDCNPSFSVYTELALVASQRIIVPCSPDGSSVRAVRNIARLVYGLNLEASHERLRFSKRLEDCQHSIPTMHLFVMNRSTIYSEQPSKDFQYIEKQIRDTVEALYEDSGNMFSAKDKASLFGNLDYMPDAHRISVLTSKKGIPLNALKANWNYGEDFKLRADTKQQIEKYLLALERIAENLGILD